jgi:hypothetical protein
MRIVMGMCTQHLEHKCEPARDRRAASMKGSAFCNALRNLLPVQNAGSLYPEFPHKRVKFRKLLSYYPYRVDLTIFAWVPSSVTSGEAMCLGHCSIGGTLRVGYLPLSNAGGTGPPSLPTTRFGNNMPEAVASLDVHCPPL